MNDFAKVILSLREEREWSQRQLALASKVSNTEINRIEKGERKRPSLSTLEKLAKAFGKSIDEFLSLAGITENYDSVQQQPKDLAHYLNQAEIMFDGDTYKITDDDRKKIRAALDLAFWDAKERNKGKK